MDTYRIVVVIMLLVVVMVRRHAFEVSVLK